MFGVIVTMRQQFADNDPEDVGEGLIPPDGRDQGVARNSELDNEARAHAKEARVVEEAGAHKEEINRDVQDEQDVEKGRRGEEFYPFLPFSLSVFILSIPV
ncbi:MAG: hypothetical protein M3362_26355 [Acidobacteriota bacterium]|nr:hypothetical protein [Acidobacteriota bacterium]